MGINRKTIFLLLANLAWLGCVALAQSSTPSSVRPNFVIFIADDMSYHDLGAWGSQDVKTPNLDRLAAQGMKLTRMFTVAPTCSPTRNALYTGLYPVRSGAHPNHTWVKDGTKSIVHYLQSLGYRVGLSGKTHIGPVESFPFELLHNQADEDGLVEGGVAGGQPDFKRIAEFLQRDKAQPFCLIVASREPHSPWNKGDAAAYDPARLTLAPYLVDTPETRRFLAKYFAEITDFDRQVGEGLRLLDESGQANNTLVLFLSEQGSSMPHGKWTLYDVGLRGAAIARWPSQIKPGSESAALVQYIDIVPTFVEAAGGEAPRDIDGRSFLNVLRGRTNKHRDYVFGVQTSRGIIKGPEAYGIRSVRDARYKYILNLNADGEFQNTTTDNKEYFASWRRQGETDAFARAQVERYLKRPALEFYDLDADPYEMNNLAAPPQQPGAMKRLRAQLEAWMRQQGDQGAATEMDALNRMAKNLTKLRKPQRQ